MTTCHDLRLCARASPGGLVVFTGHAKGKTTSALSQALSYVALGKRVLMIQFIKNEEATGELKASRKIPGFELRPMGRGMQNFLTREIAPEDRQAVRRAWRFYQERQATGADDLIVLDEINNVLAFGLLPLDEVCRTIQERPPQTTLILTGRDAPPELMALADEVIWFEEIKHYMHEGQLARPGIEF